MNAFTKVVRPGICSSSLFCSISYDGRNLSITGVEGPLANGNARGSCGQVVDSLGRLSSLAEGWTIGMVAKFRAVWDRWHLNDMRPACEHQRARGETWSTHPCAQCPDCGYVLGSAWLFEEVPEDVLAWLAALPDTDRTPAWV